MNRNHFFVWILCAAALSLAGCGGGGSSEPDNPLIYTRDEASQHGTWTVLIYLDADNNLETYGVDNFNQMEKVGSTQNVRIVVQMDRHSGDWTDTRRYLVTHDTDEDAINSLRLDDTPLGELDMADPNNLKDFVEWGVAEFPADHYCLVIWDHGNGWLISRTSQEPVYKSVVSDWTDDNVMNITDIPAALSGVSIAVLAFDACLMQQLEVAYELRGSAEYMVGSTASELAPGYDYEAWLDPIGPLTTPQQMCEILVAEYVDSYPPPQSIPITMSAIDLAKIGQVANAGSTFAELLAANASAYSSELKAARIGALNYSTSYYSVDLLDYAQLCRDALTPAADSAYADLSAALTDALVAEAHNPDTPDASGLAVYVPRPASYNSNYGDLELAQDTSWDEWLTSQVE